MNKAMLITGLITLTAINPCYADDTINITAKQIQSLGITTAALPSKQSGEVSGLPAQIIIPGNQLFIISNPLPAIVEQTLVGVGDSVKKGQPIVYLQSPAFAEAQRSLLQASVQKQLAHENLLRDESLYKDGIIAQSRYLATRGLSMQAEAALSERKQMLRLSGMSAGMITNLQSNYNLSSQLTLTSPIDGVVLEKSANGGQRLDTPVTLFKIGQLTPLAIEIQAPLAYTRDLKIGAAISVPAYSASGTLTAIGRSLTGTNQTILLRGTIVQGAGNLRPGQYVEATIRVSASNSAHWDIPNSAISRIDGRNLVFVQTSKGFRAQSIQILNEGAQNSVISGTLKGDEIIAIQGVSALKANFLGIGGVN